MKTGLVLEGGAMRGIYTAGVLDVLMEHRLYTDGVIGVSAGAIHGTSYVSMQPRRSIRYSIRLCRKWRFMSFRSLVLTGNLVNTKFCYDAIPNRLAPLDYQKFMTSGIEFYATCTNLRTGAAAYHRCTDLRREVDWIRASASLPLVSKIVWIDGEPYLDGGIADSVPLKAFEKMGFERNIVVLTQVKGYRKTPSTVNRLKRAYHRFPNFQKALHDRPDFYNREIAQIEEAERRGEVLIIRPSRELHIRRMDKNRRKLMEMYKLGRSDAMKKLPEIRRFLAASKSGSA